MGPSAGEGGEGRVSPILGARHGVAHEVEIQVRFLDLVKTNSDEIKQAGGSDVHS